MAHDLHIPTATAPVPATSARISRAALEGSIVTRFEEVAARHASEICVTGNDQSWTFQELDARANKIAQAIAEQVPAGVGCVAYLVDHSPNMIVCALAILKAGKAFLCIHPALPAAAQREIILDAAPEAILTDAAHESAARAISDQRIPILLLENIDDRHPSVPLNRPIDASQPAAIFYTSGSTGQPKGVVKSHRTILHRAWLSAQYDSVSPSDRQSLLTYCSFASSEADLFGALLNGASVHLYDVGTLGLLDFGAWIDDQRITLLHPPVVLFRRYLSILEGHDRHPSLRLVMLAGEAVVENDIAQWRKRFSRSCGMRCRFSSTEAGHVAVGLIEPGEMPQEHPLPVVRAVADKHLLIVDESGQPVSDGEPGELVVRSAYLSDGYWGRWSSDEFTDDPDHPGQRRFRTGDMARLHSDGRFEFLGRIDNQVKIRGYRIELREIETALLKLPGIKESAVVAVTQDGETQLTGFVVPVQGQLLNPTNILRELRTALPSWKIPARILAIDTLPLTLTGKVDRLRLREHIVEVAPSASVPADSDPLMAQITQIWEKVLGKRGIGADDNFFDLGAHSLRTAQLIHHLKLNFGVTLPLSILSKEATVRKLAALIRDKKAIQQIQQADPAGDSDVVPLKLGGSYPPLFFVPAARGSPLTYLPLASMLTDEQPVYALQFPQQDESGQDASTEVMAAGFAASIRRVYPDGPYRLCGHSYGAVLAYEVARQLVESGQTVELLAMLDGMVPGMRRQLSLLDRLRLHLRLTLRRPRTAIPFVARHVRRLFRREPQQAAPPKPVFARAQTIRVYQPLPYPGVISLFRATENLGWVQFTKSLPYNGWDAYCPRVEVYPVPGNHLSIIRKPNLTTLAASLNARLKHLSDER